MAIDDDELFERQFAEPFSFDGDSDRATQEENAPLRDEGARDRKVDVGALQRNGALAAARIAADAAIAKVPGGDPASGSSDDPNRDPNVLSVLRGVFVPIDEFDEPYDATVVTEHEPLRLRARPNLRADVLCLMPRGAVVHVSGPSQNSFRPVSYDDPTSRREIRGWAFTYYLSPVESRSNPTA